MNTRFLSEAARTVSGCGEPSPNKPSSRRVRVVMGLLRVAGVATLGYLGASYWLTHEAGAQAAERVGRGLDSLAGLLGPSETVELNGRAVHVSSEVVSKTVEQIREELRRNCFGETDVEGSAATSPAEPGSWGALLRPDQLLWQELGNDSERLMVCFRPRIPVDSWSGLGQRLTEAMASGDTETLGEVRLARIRPEGEHSQHVLLAYSEGGFSLGAWMDDSRDAPGVDPLHTPRPPQARRLLSARVHGTQAGAYGYASTAELEVLRAFYAEQLPAKGFGRVGSKEGAAGHADVYSNDDSFTVLGFTADPQGKVLVNIVETPTYDD